MATRTKSKSARAPGAKARKPAQRKKTARAQAAARTTGAKKAAAAKTSMRTIAGGKGRNGVYKSSGRKTSWKARCETRC